MLYITLLRPNSAVTVVNSFYCGASVITKISLTHSESPRLFLRSSSASETTALGDARYNRSTKTASTICAIYATSNSRAKETVTKQQQLHAIHSIHPRQLWYPS